MTVSPFIGKLCDQVDDNAPFRPLARRGIGHLEVVTADQGAGIVGLGRCRGPIRHAQPYPARSEVVRAEFRRDQNHMRFCESVSDDVTETPCNANVWHALKCVDLWVRRMNDVSTCVRCTVEMQLRAGRWCAVAHLESSFGCLRRIGEGESCDECDDKTGDAFHGVAPWKTEK